MSTLSLDGQTSKLPFVRELTVILLAGITLLFCLHGSKSMGVSESGVIMQLPEELRQMQGKVTPESESEKAILPGDTEMVKMTYQDSLSDNVSVQIVLAGGEKRSIHRPEICLPAQGWTLDGGHVKTVKLSNGHDLQVMRLTARRPIVLNNGTKSELENVFYYWFVGHNATTPYHLRRILMTNLDMVFHNINHRWAYVVVSAPVLKGLAPHGKDLQQTDEMLSASIAELAPKIMKNP
jgi:hypothetical protein